MSANGRMPHSRAVAVVHFAHVDVGPGGMG